MQSLKIIFSASCFLLTTVTSYTQENQEYVLNEIGWKITIPLDFMLYDFIDETRNVEMSSGFSDEYDQAMDVFVSQTNIVAIKNRFNYFNITTAPFEPEEDGSWEEVIQLSKDEAYRNMQKLVDGEKLDTASSVEYIDDIAFNKFHISVTLNSDVQLHLLLISRLYKGYDFNITYLSSDNDARQQIELMLRSSRFSKN